MKKSLYLLLGCCFIVCFYGRAAAQQLYITTIAGTGTPAFLGDGGPASAAEISGPNDVAVDASGNIYIADGTNNRVRKINSFGIITTVAGGGSVLGSGGPATAAQLSNPMGIAFDAAGNMYVSDFGHNIIRKINTLGTISTIAGSGAIGDAGDGSPATASSVSLHGPMGMAFDAAGNLYIAEFNGNRVRKINMATGIISTFVGNGAAGYSGDGSPATATSVELDNPANLAFDAGGNLYISDNFNSAIRRVDATTGIITTIAGNGTTSYSITNGVPATATELGLPDGLVIDASGNLYFTDNALSLLREVNTSGIISTLVGNGVAGYNGNYILATAAQLYAPTGIALDANGHLLIADGDSRIRLLLPNHTPAFTGGTSQMLTVCENSVGNPINSLLAVSDSDAGQPETWSITTAPAHGLVVASYSVTATGSTLTPAGLSYTPATGYSGTDAFTVQVSDGLSTAVTVITASVNPFTAGTITGPSIVYSCNSINLADATSTVTGTWSSSNPAVATVSGSGVVSAVSVGYTTISYAITNSCGTVAARKEISVGVPTITTIAGINGIASFSGDGGQASAATLHGPHGITADAAGNIYIDDDGNGAVRKINASTGIITTVAGIGGTTGTGADGIAATASLLGSPFEIALDASGNIFIGDPISSRVRKVDATTGIITSVAGISGSAGFSGDGGAASTAKLSNPAGVTFDAAGNLYIADAANGRVRKVTPTGFISTVAGGGSSLLEGVVATTASLNNPNYVHIDPSGNLVITDNGHQKMRSVNSIGIINTVAGNGTASYAGDGGPATAAEIQFPGGVAYDGAGNMYFADYSNNAIRIVNGSDTISTFVGTGILGYRGDGNPPTAALLYNPADVTFDPNGNLLIADYNNNVIRKVAPVAAYIGPVLGSSVVCPGSTITLTNGANGGTWSSGNPGIATVNSSTGVVMGVAPGNVYIYYSITNSCGTYVAKALVTVGAPVISLVAGNGTTAYSGEGVVATASAISNPAHTAMDSHGNIYFADYANDRIRMVTPGGIMTTIAGIGFAGLGADGIPATSSAISGVASMVFDAAGDLYFCDYINSKIRMINTSGIVTTIAGTGTSGAGTDGVAATASELNGPWGIVIDGSGNIVFADRYNNRIRKINLSAGIISTIAGTGGTGYNGDGGAATAATVYQPCDVAIDISGNLYIGDFSNNVVRKISTTGIISTVAGTGAAGYSGDGGSAILAKLNTPVGVAVDSAYNVYVSDYGNNIIRKINTSGIITTIAGTYGIAGYLGDGGPPTAAYLKSPQGVAIYNSGDLYIADASNNRIRKITPVNTSIAPVSGGTPTFCQGISTTFTDAVSGGVWSSSNTGIAYANPTSGQVTGTGGGTDTIAYTITYGCGALSSTQTVNVMPLPNPGIITGPSSIVYSCNTLTLSDATGSGGAWSSSTPAVATVTGGVVTGVSVGNATISYTETNACGAVAAKYQVSVATPIITTIAGTPGVTGYSGDGNPATTAKFTNPQDIAVDGSGNIYIADQGNNVIRKIDASGIITTIAGPGTVGILGDGGPATAANLSFPIGVAVDAAGNVYFSDANHYRVRKINLAGTISTVAGNGILGFSGDGFAATTAELYGATGLTFDAAGNLYVGDDANNRVRKVDLAGIITTFAGTGLSTYNGDGMQATATNLNSPSYVHFDAGGNLLVSELNGNRVRSIKPWGVTNVIAGTGVAGYSGDGGPATAAKISAAFGINVDGANNIYICDGNHRIRIINSVGIINTYAGTGTSGYAGDNGPPTAAQLWQPQDVAFDPNGNMLLVDESSNSVRKIAPIAAGIAPIQGPSVVCPGNTITLTDAAGGGQWSSSNPTIATVGTSTGIVTGLSIGNTVITDSIHNTCGSFSTKALVTVGVPTITTIAGNGTATYGGDGLQATVAQIHGPSGAVIDGSGNIYFCDYYNNRIRKINSLGIISTIAGNGTGGYNGDGSPATAASVEINTPSGLAIDAAGNIYFAEYNNNLIRKINTLGIISTVIGTGPAGSGFTPDGPTSATSQINHPPSIYVDAAGNLYFSEASQRIRKLSTVGILTTIAGTGSSGYSGDGGMATSALLRDPFGLAFDPIGNMYIADQDNNCIRKVNSSGVITTIAGTTASGYAGDGGAAVNAQFHTPTAIVIDGAGNLDIADRVNNCIRQINMSTGIITTIVGIGGTSGTYGGDGGPPTAANLNNVPFVNSDAAGNLYISDFNGNRIRKVAPINPSVAPISGPSAVCLGGTIPFTDITAAGTWTSSNSAVASVGSNTGVVTGAGIGSANISYTVSFSCGNITVVQAVSVNSLSTITGSPSVCLGATTQLNNTTGGGTWSSINAATATVGSAGLVTGMGISPDTTTITYTLGACFVNTVVTVAPLPSAISPATASVCVGNTTSLTDPESGGTWGVSNGHGSVVSGTVTGLTAGVDTVSYSLGGCATTATVNVLAVPSPISPSSTPVCIGVTTILNDPSGGGAWSSSNGNASVVGGTVTGAIAGVDTISYTLGGCAATATVTVNAGPGAITPPGAVNICVGATVTLADPTTPIGVWSNDASGHASVDASSGLVTGISAGAANISFTNTAGCSTAKTITVNITPDAITPASSVACIGNQTTLTDAVAGGTWASTNGNASVVGGTVTGAFNGVDTISYTIGSCAATATVTVNASPGAITASGALVFCVGGGVSLSALPAGGTWSSQDNSIATVSSSGAVSGVAAGSVNISYTNAAGCSSVKMVTVSITPSAISPATAQLCTATTATLTDAVGPGTWTSSAGGVASVTGGVVTGVSFGTATITYSIGSCSATAFVTVNLSPVAGVVSGPSSLCISAPVLYTDFTTGGTWRSSNSTVATVSPGGLVTGIGVGIDSIIYSVNNGCGTAIAAVTVAVSATPGAGVIVGPSTICAGTYSFLTDSVTGGTWVSSNATGTITSAGLFSGITTGSIDTISYTVINACGTATAKKAMNIGAYLTAGVITGATTVCQGASVTLTDLAPSGTWGMSNTSADVVGGVVTGLGGGVDTVYYTVSSVTGCGFATASHVITVSPLPVVADISGPSTLCVGITATYADSSAGGLWNVTNPSATITGWGFLTAVTPGVDTVTYSIANSCGTTSSTQILTIGPAITAGTISGGESLCAGASTTLTDAAIGGSWSSSNASATVTSGAVTAVFAGIDTIAYTVTSSCGSVAATAMVTINPLPVAGVISGSSALCLGSPMTYTDAASGGVWSSSNATATVSGGGLVTPVTAGTDTISYTVSNVCGTATATQVVAISSSADAGTITGGSSVCVGSLLTLTDAVTGGTWSSSTADAIVVGGAVTGILAGTDIISYTVTGSCGTAIATALIAINPLPYAGGIAGVPDVCVLSTTLLSDAAPGGSWSAVNTNATVSGGLVSGVTAGTDIISYTVTNSCGTAAATVNVTISASADAGVVAGASDICIGSAITLTDPVTGGAWSSSNASATVSGGVVTGVSLGTDTINYVVVNACGTATASKAISVDLSPIAGTITGALGVCKGETTLLTITGGLPGGAWSSSNATATVSGGVVTGVNVGIDTISYTVTNSCGTATATKMLYVNTTPSPGTIAGPSNLCVGGAITLTDGVSGGTWSSSNSTIASVAGGMVSGIAPGSATISYTVSNGCGPRSASHAVSVVSNADCNTLVNKVNSNGVETLDVFPNPNTGTFTMNVASDNDEEVTVVITNITGEKVREFTTTTNKTIELNLNGATGIYFLSATTSKGNYVAKVVID